MTMNTQQLFRLALTVLILISASFVTRAQTQKESFAPREGFWVVETAPKSHQCTVRFYSDEKKLIYEETLNRSLNITRRQTKRHLNAALEQALFVWNNTCKIPTDRQWVATQFKN
jgi:hypothetical protein